MNSNYELSHWERMAEEQLSRPQMPMLQSRGMGTIRNNRKATNGRKIQVVQLKNGSTRQIRRPTLG